jgi:hypothetical protein
VNSEQEKSVSGGSFDTPDSIRIESDCISALED